MPQDNASAGHEEVFPHQVTEMGKKYADAVMNVQAGLLDELRRANEEWMASAQSRLALASDLYAKLIAARSLPDAAAACQEWTQQRADLLAEDGRHALIHGQKFLEAGTRFFSNGSPNATV